MKEAGAIVELHTDHFAENARDPEWLPVVGQRKWVILTKDSKLLTNQLEIIAQDPARNETVARREAFLEIF